MIGLLSMVACSDDDEMPEDNEEEEEISLVTLTFSPDGGGADVVANWFDEDGEGIGAAVIDNLALESGVSYTLSVEFTNTLGTEDEDITEEIMEEDDEHQIFFGFTNNIFSSPSGDGNIDSGSDALNYEDQDDNDLPVGLSTSWTTGGNASGEFRVLLKHQPDAKTASSDSNTGSTDVDISFPLSIN